MTAALLLAALAVSAPDRLQSVLDEQRASQVVPGVSAVVVRGNDVVFIGASGVEDLNTDQAVTADSVFYIGSVGKVLTAVLALNLVDSGELVLDEPVAELRHMDEKNPISARQLLSHSSGLEREGDFGYWFNADFPGGDALWRYLDTARLRNPPGTALHYSNIGYAVLGQLIERVAGKGYSEALSELVLAPLGMEQSGGRGPAPAPAMGYTPLDRILPGETRPFAGVGKRVGRRHERTYHDARAMSPAFGAYSTANDMGRFVRFLLGHGHEEVLSQSGRRQLYEPQPSGRGLGLRPSRRDGRLIARHDGWFAAHRTHLLLDIDNGIGVVVMANSDNASPGRIAEALLSATLAGD